MYLHGIAQFAKSKNGLKQYQFIPKYGYFCPFWASFLKNFALRSNSAAPGHRPPFPKKVQKMAVFGQKCDGGVKNRIYLYKKKPPDRGKSGVRV